MSPGPSDKGDRYGLRTYRGGQWRCRRDSRRRRPCSARQGTKEKCRSKCGGRPTGCWSAVRLCGRFVGQRRCCARIGCGGRCSLDSSLVFATGSGQSRCAPKWVSQRYSGNRDQNNGRALLCAGRSHRERTPRNSISFRQLRFPASGQPAHYATAEEAGDSLTLAGRIIPVEGVHLHQAAM